MTLMIEGSLILFNKPLPTGSFLISDDSKSTTSDLYDRAIDVIA